MSHSSPSVVGITGDPARIAPLKQFGRARHAESPQATPNAALTFAAESLHGDKFLITPDFSRDVCAEAPSGRTLDGAPRGTEGEV